MTWPVGAVLAIGLFLIAPYAVPRSAVRPSAGIAMWITVLGLRAAVCATAVSASALYLPSTAPFQAASGWCVHAVVPFFARHFGLSGHALGDAASFVPAAVLLILAISAALGALKALRAAALWLGQNTVGSGPSKSVIVGDAEVIVATAGIRNPKVIVSAGALLDLDDAELEAGLFHEWGHVRRGHRVLTLASVACLAASRLLPGGRRASEELQFHLERDADEYAVSRTGDRLALASAICKTAAGGAMTHTPLAVASLTGANTAERLKLLLGLHEGPRQNRRYDAFVSVLFAGALTAVGALLILLPELIVASAAQAYASIDQLKNCF